jgi:sugar lactone lactonase YvrE
MREYMPAGCTGIFAMHRWVLLMLLVVCPLKSVSLVVRTILGGSEDGSTALQTLFMYPMQLYFDNGMNALYVADTWRHRVRVVGMDGSIKTVAGCGSEGYWGDYSAATLAAFRYPMGLAKDDATSELYVADSSNHRIRKVTIAGTITPVLGSTSAGYNGDMMDTHSGTSLLNTPMGLAMDNVRRVLYIADSGNNRIRKYDLVTKILSLVAGDGVASYAGDGVAGMSASLRAPSFVAVDQSTGDAFISDSGNHVIRRFAASSGNIETIAGIPTIGAYFGEGAMDPLDAAFKNPGGLSYDTNTSTLYIADQENQRIRRVVLAPSTSVTTFAGVGFGGNFGDGGPATNAALTTPGGVVVDSASGYVFIADTNNFLVRRVVSGIINTIAGRVGADSSAPLSAGLVLPFQVNVPSNADVIHVLDAGNDIMRQMTPTSLQVIAGQEGFLGYDADDKPATSSMFNHPLGSSYDWATNRLYIADTSNHRVRYVDSSGYIRKFAGTGSASFSGDFGPASAATLNNPYSTTVDSTTGTVFIADFANQRVRMVSPNGTIFTIAGTGVAGYNTDGVQATSAMLNNPACVVWEPVKGLLYIVDSWNFRIRVIRPDGIIQTAAGTGLNEDTAEGLSAPATGLLFPSSVSFDSITGCWYIADTVGHRIRQVLPNGKVYTLAGTGLPGYLDNATALQAPLSYPRGVHIDPLRAILYIADTNNNRIRVVQLLMQYTVVTQFSWTSARANVLLPVGVPGCLFNSTNLSATLAEQATTQGFQWWLRRPLLNGTIFSVPCSGVNLLPHAASVDAQCARAAVLNCSFANPLVGTGWQLGYTWRATDGTLLHEGFQQDLLSSSIVPNMTRVTISLAQSAGNQRSLLIFGAGYWATPGLPVTVSYNGQACGNTSIINSSVVASVCDVGDGSMYWRSATVILSVADYILTVNIPPFLDAPPVQVNQTTAAWGDVLNITADFIGVAPAWLNLSVGGMTSLPCAPLTSWSRNTILCSILPLPEGWFGAHITFTMGFVGNSWVSVLNASASIIGARPSATFLQAPPLLNRLGGDVINFGFTADLPTSSMYAGLGLPTPVNINSLRLWIGGQVGAFCSAASPRLVTCTTIAGSLPQRTWVLEVGGLFNMSSTAGGTKTVSFAPPPLTFATPALILLPPPGSAPLFRTFLLNGTGLSQQNSWMYMANVSIGSVACNVSFVSSTQLRCSNWDSSLFANNAGGASRLTMNVSYYWGNDFIAIGGIAVAVARPVLLQVSPRVAIVGQEVLLVGNDLCPPPVCITTADLRIWVGGLVCPLKQILNASAVSCVLPANATSAPSYPQLNIVVQNAAGVNSTDTVAVYLPSSVTSVTSTSVHVRLQTATDSQACIWDPGNSTSANIQAAVLGWSFFQRSFSGTTSTVAFDLPCASVTLTQLAAAELSNCSISAALVCTFASPVDGGIFWKFCAANSDHASVKWEWMQDHGPEFSAPVAIDGYLINQGGLVNSTSASVQLDLFGRNFGQGVPNMPTPAVQWPTTECQTVLLRNSSMLSAWCSITGTPAVLYWVDRPVTVTVLNNVAAAVVSPLLPRPPITVHPGNVTWGTALSLTSTWLGAANVTNIMVFVAAYPAARLPCARIEVVSNNVITCVLTYIDGLWYNKRLSFEITIWDSGSTWLVDASEAAVTFVEPQLAGVNLPLWLVRAGGETVSFSLPQPRFQSSELMSMSISATTSARAWFDGASSTCAFTSQTELECTTPAGYRPNIAIFVELFARFNVSTSTLALSVSYAPPSIVSASPSALLLPGPNFSPAETQRTLVFNSAQLVSSFPYLSAFQLGVAQCGTARLINDTSFACEAWNSTVEAAAVQNTHATASLPLGFTWAGVRFNVPAMVLAYSRPGLSSIDPPVVQQGTLVTIYGSNICPSSLCDSVASFAVYVGNKTCSSVTIITPNVITCKVPDIQRSAVGYPYLNVSVCTNWQACSLEVVRVQYPTSFRVAPSSILPDSFIPSDSTVPAMLSPKVVFRLISDIGATTPPGSCTLSSNTLSASITTTDGNIPTAVLSNQSIATFPDLIVSTTFATSSVLVSATCAFSSGGDALAPFQWPLMLVPITVQFCAPPPSTVRAQQVFPVWSVGLQLPSTVAACAVPTAAVDEYKLPAVVCSTRVLNNADNDTAIIQRGVAGISNTTLQASFDQLTLLGSQGSTYQLAATCSIGQVLLPPGQLHFDVTINGCEAGTEPVGFFCNKCAESAFALGGGQAKCTACPPVGAVCSGGVLTLLDGFYRPPSQSNRDLGPDTELHACYNAEACTLNRTILAYGCREGYTGPLCGVCDPVADFGLYGEVCRGCWSAAANQAAFAFLVLALLALLSFVALRKSSGGGKQASIALRILVTYVQAVGSLRAFKAGGTRIYHELMGWTDSVSASPFSSSLFVCMFRWSYELQYSLLVLMPGIVVLAVCLIFVISAVAKSVGKQGRVLDLPTLRTIVGSWTDSQRHVSTFVFVLSAAYMPIVSASIRALDCLDVAVDGKYYLRSDLSVDCANANYTTVRALSIVILAVYGAGFPLLVITTLWRVQPATLHDETFKAAYGFLYHGYKIHEIRRRKRRSALTLSARTGTENKSWLSSPLTVDHLVWWEGLVLFRKAGIAALSVLIRDPQQQLICAVLLLGSFAHLQQSLQPYAVPRFNQLELLSLMSGTATAVICMFMVIDGGSGAVTASSTTTSPTAVDWAVSAALLIVNLSTLIVLAFGWLALQLKQGKEMAQRVATLLRRKSTRKKFSPRTARSTILSIPPLHLNSADEESDCGAKGTPHSASTSLFGPEEEHTDCSSMQLNPLRQPFKPVTVHRMWDDSNASEVADSSHTPTRRLSVRRSYAVPATVVGAYAATPTAGIVGSVQQLPVLQEGAKVSYAPLQRKLSYRQR